MMNQAAQDAIAACEWGTSHFLLFSSNVFDPLIYYSHFVPLLASVVFGLLLVFKSKNNLAARILLCTLFFLVIWLVGDLNLWATEFPQVTMFSWSLINLAEPFVYAFSLYFIYVYVEKKDISFLKKLIIFVPLIPVILLTPTHFALLGYDLSNCDRDAVEGILVYYGYVLEVVYTLWIVILGFERYLTSTVKEARQQIFLVSLGTVLFLLSFAFGNIIGSLFSDLTIFGDYSWTIGQYGLFGVPVFIGFLSYLTVRFRAFNVGLIAAQALVGALVVILAAEFAFVRSLLNQILVGITLFLTFILGVMLIRSVQREIKQREKIEIQEKELELANEQQVALIHFITHQIKGFLTKSRNIFAGLMEGDYGAIADTAKPMVKEGFDSGTSGVNTVQEILNASNIKTGKVTYTFVSFDLKALVEKIFNELKAFANTKGLAYTFSADGEPFTYTGDAAQLTNAFKNIIDNCIKYTPSGSVKVTLMHGDKKIVFKTEDTGVGITEEDKQHLFTEGGHGKESQKVNTESTGFGLYIVKNIIEAHKGTVRAESGGPGKGSQFIVELPIQG